MSSQVSRVVKDATDLASARLPQIAHEIGVSALTISHWRNGKRNATPGHLAALGRALLKRARALERAATNLLEIAQEAQSRLEGFPESEGDDETLEIFSQNSVSATNK